MISSIRSPRYSRSRYGLYAVLAVAVLLPLSLDAITGNALTTTKALNADTLWTLAFLRDIFVDGGHLADWNIGQHTDFFPDKLFAAAAYAISSRPDRWLFAFETLNLTLYFGIAWYCLWLCLRTTRDRTNALQTSLWAALLVTALPPFIRGWGLFDLYLRYIGIPSNHFGQFFCAILAAFIVIDCFSRPSIRASKTRLLASCALMLLCAVSDKLTIIVAVPGVIAAAVFAAAGRRLASPLLLICCGGFCAAAAVGYFASDLLWNQFVEVMPAHPAFDPAWFKRQLQPVVQSLLTRSGTVESMHGSGIPVPRWSEWDGVTYVLAHLEPIQMVILGVAGVFTLAMAIVYARRAISGVPRPTADASARMSADAFMVYLVASALAIPLALLAVGVLSERYVYPAGYCILWALAAKAAELLPQSLSRAQLGVGMTVTAGILSAVPIDVSAPPFRPLPKPSLVKCLEEYGESKDLRLGLGSYWETYPIDFFSEHRIVVRSVLAAGQIVQWVNNFNWYAPGSDGRLFTFVISDPYLDEAGLRGRIGDPTETLKCSELGPAFGTGEILYYDASAAERLTGWIHEQYWKYARPRL